jgi:hypothetical protein
MQHGDLVYIPQDVLLFDRKNIFIDKTEKPIVGVFLQETPVGASWQGGTYIIYALGRKAVVQRKCVYPLEEQYAH